MLLLYVHAEQRRLRRSYYDPPVRHPNAGRHKLRQDRSHRDAEPASVRRIHYERECLYRIVNIHIAGPHYLDKAVLDRPDLNDPVSRTSQLPRHRDELGRCLSVTPFTGQTLTMIKEEVDELLAGLHCPPTPTRQRSPPSYLLTTDMDVCTFGGPVRCRMGHSDVIAVVDQNRCRAGEHIVRVDVDDGEVVDLGGLGPARTPVAGAGASRWVASPTDHVPSRRA